MALRLVPGRTYFRHKRSGIVWGYNEMYRQSSQFEEFVYESAEDDSEPMVVGPKPPASDDISGILDAP